MQILQKNINTSLKALNKLSDQIENQMLIQHNMYLTEKLLNSLQSVQRMITLAFNEISNLEIISVQELFQILHHLKLIYKRDELIELNGMHVLKIIEFSKFKILSVDNVITCTSPRQEIVNSDLNCKSFYNRTAKRLIATINNF
jgi:hypothetical protein